MVMINNSIIKRAIEEAKISTFHQRHGCVIFKGNRILNTAHNEIRYCNRLDVRYKKWINSLHAEQKAILFSRFDLKRCSILVIRLDPFDNLTSSKPCPVCMGLIQNVGIGKIYYSTKIGQIVEFKGDTC
jgi:deoxycytidylate deaminase